MTAIQHETVPGKADPSRKEVNDKLFEHYKKMKATDIEIIYYNDWSK